jgi:hypothetical protein
MATAAGLLHKGLFCFGPRRRRGKGDGTPVVMLKRTLATAHAAGRLCGRRLDFLDR